MRAALRSSILFAAISAAAVAESARSAQLPENVVARVDARDITEAEFASFVGTETLHEPPAAELLALMEQDRVIELEAARRNVVASDSDVDAAWKRFDDEARRHSNGSDGIAATLAAREITDAEFRHELQRLVLLERMARQDFDIDDDDPVPPEKQTLWLQDRLAKAAIESVDDPALVARVEGTPITAEDLGRRYLVDLARRGRRDQQLLDQLIGVVVLEETSARRGIKIDEADLDRAIAEREARLRKKPGFEEAGLDDVLRKSGRSVERLKASRRFRAMLLLERLADRRYTDPELRKYLEAHRAELDKKLGAAVELETIFLRAGTEGARSTGFVKRGYDDAQAELIALRGRIERGELAFADAVRTRSEHPSAASGGSLGAVRAGTPTLEALFESAFSQQDGALVGPVITPDGVHLARVVKHVPAPPFEEIREPLRAEARENYYKSLVADARVEKRER